MPRKNDAPIRHGQLRPGGRTEQVRKDVAASVLALIQAGRVDFSYAEVAEVSGVNKATLYRRWPQRVDLLGEAITEHNSTLKLPVAKSWPDSAEALIRELAVFLASPAEMALNVALLSDPAAEANALLVEQWAPIQERIVQLARDAQANGELDDDIDPAALMLMLVSPVLVMALFQRGVPMDKKLLGQIIKIVRRMTLSE